MLLLAEIILTIVAWRKGWRIRALLPLGIVGGIGMLWGVGISASGGEVGSVIGLFLLLDLICIGALVRMAIYAPKHTPQEASVQALRPEEPTNEGVRA